MSRGGLPFGSVQLPTGFTSIQDILDEKLPVGSKAKVIGLATDVRAPIPTRGTDWKCQIRLYDTSIQYDLEASILLSIFRPESEVEKLAKVSLGDVFVILDGKVQSYRGDGISLLTSFSTEIFVYKAGSIPRPPSDASPALVQQLAKPSRRLSKPENEFICSLYHGIDKDRLPSEMEFETRVLQSTNARDKFGELKDAKDGKFYDFVVQFVKAPYDSGDKMTLWVSDYTENPAFFNHAINVITPSSGGQDGDPFGYCSKFSKSSVSKTAWTGPFGKRSMQVTCYEPHASVIRNQKLGEGSWVWMRNVQVKYGSSATNLEGFLREDRMAGGVKINLFPLDPTEDRENLKPELIEAIRRKRDYERLKKVQKKDLDEAGKAGKKRKAAIEAAGQAEPPAKMNAKERRKLDRAKTAKKLEQEKKPLVPLPNLNAQVKCEKQNTAPSSVADIVSPQLYEAMVHGEASSISLPFVNANYRANVRVVNFAPSRLEDFAFPRKKNPEFDILSDNEGDESESDQDALSQPSAGVAWEWRFFLELEDAVVTENQEKNRVWALVDNQSAQCLINLDASDLKHDQENINMLRQRMFLLWGDLEEHKNRQAAKMFHLRQKDRPPPDSSDDEGDKKDDQQEEAMNVPFSCCIRQYGVKVPEADQRMADAGDGKRWERVYGLFGTRISGT